MKFMSPKFEVAPITANLLVAWPANDMRSIAANGPPPPSCRPTSPTRGDSPSAFASSLVRFGRLMTSRKLRPLEKLWKPSFCTNTVLLPKARI